MVKEKVDNRINTVIETALKNLTQMVDVNTIIGKPISIESGELVVPVSKVTLGILSGGGEYGKISIFKSGNDLPYSAGNGAVISVKPCGFLVKSDGRFKLISTDESVYEKIFDSTKDFVEKITEKQS